MIMVISLNLFFYFLLLFKYTFLPFPPTPAQLPTSLRFLHPPRYCPCVLYNCSYKPFTLFPWNSLPSPLWSLSACSQFQCLWLYFACLFVLLIRFQLKIIGYLSFTTWLISLSIILPSSIHAVTEGRSSSFLLLQRIPLCKCTTVFWIQTGAATVENSMEFPHKTKNGTAFWPSNSTARIIP